MKELKCNQQEKCWTEKWQKWQVLKLSKFLDLFRPKIRYLWIFHLCEPFWLKSIGSEILAFTTELIICNQSRQGTSRAHILYWSLWVCSRASDPHSNLPYVNGVYLNDGVASRLSTLRACIGYRAWGRGREYGFWTKKSGKGKYIHIFPAMWSNEKLLSLNLICKRTIERLNEIICVQYLT